MCGIAGILGVETEPCVLDMTHALRHRGPDCQATIALPNAHLGAARLRIVDLSAGDQPLVSARSGAVLVFNGEIYNYHDLRKRLEMRGHRFETATDSEVVLRAYEEYGLHCVEHLRGMYAFAIVHGARALLARDPFGIKPLYYCALPGRRTFVFASEIKSLLRCPAVPARINEACLGDLRAFEYVADPRATLFEDIFALEPGCCLDIELSQSGLTVQRRSFTPAAERVDPAPSVEAAERDVDELLDAAVRSHQMADVPICLTLSGGLDSTCLGLLLRQQVGASVVSYAAGDDADHVDVQQAQRMAAMLGFEHRPVMFTFEQYLAAIAPSILASESFVDGVPPYLLFREIGRDFRVALNGEGADEVFGGYPEHWLADRYIGRIRDAAESLPLTERGAMQREQLRSAPPADGDDWIYHHLLGSQLIDRHLHPLDKLSMASSVEVRVPFLDYELAAYVRRLPSAWRVNRRLGSSKYILRRAYLRRLRATDLPSGLTEAVLREKRGFPDARRASASRFHQLCERILPERYLAEHPRRAFLFHKAQGIWFDLFEFLLCGRRGAAAADIDILDFIAQRAGQPRAAIASTAAHLAAPRRSASPS